MAVWTVKGGRHGEREHRLLTEGILGGGWGERPDLSGVGSKERLRDLYETTYPAISKNAVSNYVGQLWSLVTHMKQGNW